METKPLEYLNEEAFHIWHVCELHKHMKERALHALSGSGISNIANGRLLAGGGKCVACGKSCPGGILVGPGWSMWSEIPSLQALSGSMVPLNQNPFALFTICET